jgi:hypothetical protein
MYTNYTQMNGRMTQAWRIGKDLGENSLCLFERHLPRRTEENHENYQSVWTVFWSRFQASTSRIHAWAVVAPPPPKWIRKNALSVIH